MAMTAPAELKEHLLSFSEVARICQDDVPDDCKFVADPFIHYDPARRLWVLFVEVALPARRQYIGILSSEDLRNWKYRGEAVKGSRESFPYVTSDHDHYLMLPCHEVGTAPGLVTIYRAASLLGPWRLASSFNLPRDVNDRVLIRSPCSDVYYLIYGTVSRFRRALECLDLTIDDEARVLAIGERKVLISRSVGDFLSSKVLNRSRLIFRPAGNVVTEQRGFFLPLQGTRTGAYGECFALGYFVFGEGGIALESIEFVRPDELCVGWSGCHHLSLYRHGDFEVFAVDGHFMGRDWEVRVFANPAAAALGRAESF